MKKFVKKILLFLGLLLLVFCMTVAVDFGIVGNMHLGQYQAAILDKTGRMKSIPGPRILLVGTSNVAFGFDSALLEEAAGIPVVNLGLHGALGYAFVENIVKLDLHEGDIVIICPESFSGGDSYDPALTWVTLEKHTELWPILRAEDIWPMLKAYPDYAAQSLINFLTGQKHNHSDGSTYSRDAFNSYGDVVVRDEGIRYVFTDAGAGVPEIREAGIERINKLNRYVREHGATLLIAGFPIGFGEYTPDAALYDAFEEQLRASIDCELISHYTDYFIPYEYFYDTYLHLNAEGAVLRTNQLISDLQDWMQHRETA